MSSTRFAYGPGPGSHVTGRGAPESTTSYDSRSEEGRDKFRQAPPRDVTGSSRDVTRDTSYSHGRDDDYYVTRKEKEEEEERERERERHASRGDTSSDTERHGSYDFRYPVHEEKVEWSCGEAGGWQKLSFLLLVITFIGHSIAVCTPYWVVGYQGDQMTLYEGVWLSCYREQGVGRWVCSNYDTIRNLFEQPPWYEASQICAVLSVILLLPAMSAAVLYSYVVALGGRSRASWVFVCFMAASALCSFLSFVVYGAGYPLDQDFPPGSARLHASFGLQIVSFLVSCACLAAHLRDSCSTLKVWDSRHDKSVAIRGFAPSHHASAAAAPARGPYVTSGRVGNVKAGGRGGGGAPKLPSFSMPRFPAALSRFRSKEPSAPPLPAPVVAVPEYEEPRDATAGRAPPAQAGAGGLPSSQRAYRAYAPSSGGGSVSGYDSQV